MIRVASIVVFLVSISGFSFGQTLDSEQIEKIQNEILSRGLRWTAGETRFTRMSAEDLERYAPSVDEPPAWILQWAMAQKAPPPPKPKGPLPAKLDWRDRLGYNFITPVRDQGNCGSCWAFSTIATLEGIISWRNSDADPSLDLSEQHLFDCASLSSLGCDSGGVTWYTTGSFMSQTGVTSEACYPYTSGQTGQKGTCMKVDDMSPECQDAIVRTEDLIEIGSTAPGWPWWDPPEYIMSPEATEEVKTYLQDRPVGTSMRVYDDFYAYHGGIYEPTTSNGGGMHAVLIVGYDDDEGYWIIKNSWTEDFGEDGFFKIKYNSSSIGMFSYVYNYAEDHAAPAFCDDIPSSVELDGTQQAPSFSIDLANCGGGILEWQAQMDQSWLVLVDPSGSEVYSGKEVAQAKSYSIEIRGSVHDGDLGTITLTGAGNGPVEIHVSVNGDHEPVADAGVFDGSSDDDAGGGEDDGSADGATQEDGTADSATVDAGDSGHQADGSQASDDQKDAGSDSSKVDTKKETSGCGCASQGGGAGSVFILLLFVLAFLGRKGLYL